MAFVTIYTELEFVCATNNIIKSNLYFWKKKFNVWMMYDLFCCTLIFPLDAYFVDFFFFLYNFLSSFIGGFRCKENDWPLGGCKGAMINFSLLMNTHEIIARPLFKFE